MLFREIIKALCVSTHNEVIRKSFPNRGLGQSPDIPASRRCSQVFFASLRLCVRSFMSFIYRRAAGGPRKLICVNPCYLWIVLLILLTGCNQSKTGGDVIHSTVEKDGISLTISRNQKTLTTVELLRLTLDVTAPQGSEFYFPNEETDFGDFTYFESHITSMKLNAKNMVEQKYSLVLEPGLSGSHTVSVLTVQYGQQSISTEPFKIEVSSILPAERTEIRDITSLTAPAGFRWIAVLGILVAIMFLDAGLLKDSDEDEKVDFGTDALNKMSKANLADIPKIFCEFLSNHFKQQVAYTGAESLVKYLENQQVNSGLISEIEKTLNRYEESRFANVEGNSLQSNVDCFNRLISKLEDKA